MSELATVCSECPNSLRGKKKGTKTCSETCRAKRSRRLKRIKSDSAANAREGRVLPEHQQVVTQVVRREAPDVAHQIMSEELRPMIREAIDDQVLQSLHDMVGLAPKVVAALREDLDSIDPARRQKAYDLWLKYTVGNPKVGKEDASNGQLVVNFALPRPDSAPEDTESEVVESEAIVTCDSCGEEKPESQFVANSTRCVTCHEELVARVQGMLDGAKDGAS